MFVHVYVIEVCVGLRGPEEEARVRSICVLLDLKSGNQSCFLWESV